MKRVDTLLWGLAIALVGIFNEALLGAVKSMFANPTVVEGYVKYGIWGGVGFLALLGLLSTRGYRLRRANGPTKPATAPVESAPDPEPDRRDNSEVLLRIGDIQTDIKDMQEKLDEHIRTSAVTEGRYAHVAGLLEKHIRQPMAEAHR